MKKPLLSHIVPARNDNYLGNFKQRLEMCINYFCKNAAETGNLENYELIICDWNSDTPLKDALYLSEEARYCTKFIEVPSSLVKQLGLDGYPIMIPHAMNLGMRHASADMILFSPTDVLFPQQSVGNLFSLLKGELSCPIDSKNCYMGIERFLIPWQMSARMTLDSIDRDLFLYSNSMNLDEKIHGLASNEGGHLISKDILLNIHGIDESLIYWGAHEVQLALRINHFAPLVKASKYGIFCYDLQQAPALRAKEIKENDSYTVYNPVVNDENWGLQGVDGIRVTKAETSLPEPHTSYLANYTMSYYDQIEERPLDLLDKAIQFFLVKNTFSYSSCIRTNKKKGWIRGSLYKRVVYLSLLRFLKDWISSSKDNNIYLSDYFDKEKLNSIVNNYALCMAKERNFSRMKLELHVAFSCLVIYAALRPVRFLNLNSDFSFPASTMSLFDPTLQITTYHDWEDATRLRMNRLRNAIGATFQGYLHQMAGPRDTVFMRLQNMELMNVPYDMVYLDLNYWHDVTAATLSEMAPLLAKKCAILCMVDEANMPYLEKTAELLAAHGFKVEARLVNVWTLIRDETV